MLRPRTANGDICVSVCICLCKAKYQPCDCVDSYWPQDEGPEDKDVSAGSTKSVNHEKWGDKATVHELYSISNCGAVFSPEQRALNFNLTSSRGVDS